MIFFPRKQPDGTDNEVFYSENRTYEYIANAPSPGIDQGIAFVFNLLLVDFFNFGEFIDVFFYDFI